MIIIHLQVTNKLYVQQSAASSLVTMFQGFQYQQQSFLCIFLVVLLDSLCEYIEGLLQIVSSFGADFPIEHIVLVGECLSILGGNLSFRLQIFLGGDKQLYQVLIGHTINLSNPAAQIAKGVGMGNIIGQNYSLSPFEVSLSNVSKSLLPSCVPNLQSDQQFVYFHIFQFEVHTNRSHIALFKHSLAIFSHQVCFAHPAVPDYHDLCQVDLLTLRRRHIIILFFQRKNSLLLFTTTRVNKKKLIERQEGIEMGRLEGGVQKIDGQIAIILGQIFYIMYDWQADIMSLIDK